MLVLDPVGNNTRTPLLSLSFQNYPNKSVLTQTVFTNIYVSISGNKYVIKSVPAGEKCDTNKFQPVKLWLNESSDCEFFKDKCSAQGQTIFRNLTTKEDRTCRCCLEMGFAYIRPPKNRCFCNPFQEDCSCYLKKSSATKNISPGKVLY